MAPACLSDGCVQSACGGRSFRAAYIKPLASHARACRGHPRLLPRIAEESRDGAVRKAWMARTSPAMTENEGLQRSAMKTILVPVEDHDSMAAVLQAAWLVARRFGSYVEGFAVQPAASEFVALDPLSSLTMPQIADGDAEIEHDSRQMFESFMATNNVPPATPLLPAPPARLSYAWVRSGGESDVFIGSHGRVFDLV